MSSLEELCELTDSEETRLVHVVGVPRSMSTALCRSLNESEVQSVYVNEPFNRMNSDADQAARFIMDAVSQHEQQSGYAAELIIVKNMASYLSDENFERFDGLATRIVWTIRHPSRQLESLITRLANDLIVGSGVDTLSLSQVYDHMNEACSYLVDSPKSKNFSKTGWESAGRLFDLAVSPYSVVNGELFAAEPHAVLGKLCTELGVPFRENMVNDWSNGFVNAVNI